MTAPPSDPTGWRLAVHSQGYRPVPISGPFMPIPSAGKRPVMDQWNSICADADEAEIRRWAAVERSSTNSGLLCGLLIGLDIDIPTEGLAAQIDAMAEAMLGPTPLHRIGSAPKRLRCYRVAEPVRKVETPELFLADGTKVQVEALANGQQFVAHGIHPDTHAPYTWPHQSPLDVAFADLPLVTEPALRAFVAAAEAVLRSAGGMTAKERSGEQRARPHSDRPGSRSAKDAGASFFRRVNDAALADIGAWVPTIFPTAEQQPGTGAWRVNSADLGRGFEEDLSIHPDGVQDFGERKPLTPIDVVMQWGGAPAAAQAAFWLCERLGRAPADFGWQGKRDPSQPGQDAGAAHDEPDADAIVAEFNARYTVVNEAGKALIYAHRHDPVLHRDLFDRITFEDLRKLYSNRRVCVGTDDKDRPILRSVAHVWLESPARRQFIGGVTFDPSGRHSPETLNLWQGFAVQPKPGNWSLLRDHVRDVICSGVEEDFAYVMGWMARMVQRPAEQGEVAIVLRGAEGTGKGTLARALKHIFGQHGLAISNAKHLTGNFNAHLRDTVFLFADEAFFAGDRQHVGVLKAIVTEPYLTIEAKYANAMQMPNFLHLMMASNETWVVPASLESRRFFMPRVSEAKARDGRYFGAIWRQMEGGGYEAMLHDLLHYDLASFNVRAFPVTEELQTQRKLSMTTEQQWWHDVLQRGYVSRSRLGLDEFFGRWFAEVSTELLFSSYAAFASERRERHPMSREAFGRFMRSMGAVARRLNDAPVGEHVKDVDSAFGSKRQATVLRQPRPPGFHVGEIDLARQGFAAATGLRVQWGDEADADADDLAA